MDWARPTDIDLAVPLFVELYRHSWPDRPIVPNKQVRAHIRRLLDATPPHRLALVWSEDGKAIGLAAVAILLSVNEPRADHQTQMQMKELFIAQDYRSVGVGEAFMGWLVEFANSQGVSRIDWNVDAKNVRGRAFYDKIGAAVMTTRLSMRMTLK